MENEEENKKMEQPKTKMVAPPPEAAPGQTPAATLAEKKKVFYFDGEDMVGGTTFGSTRLMQTRSYSRHFETDTKEFHVCFRHWQC